MASSTLISDHASGGNLYLRLFSPSGQWFDFADNTWKTSGTGTTPYRQATYDSTEKVYRINTAINWVNVWNKGSPLDVTVLWYSNVSPATGDSPVTDAIVIPVQFGQIGRGDIVCECDINILTTAGLVADLVCWLECDGQRIALTAGSAAITLTEKGSGIDQWTVTDAAPNADGVFEMTKTTPAFTSDRIYIAKVAITENGATWTTFHSFKPIG